MADLVSIPYGRGVSIFGTHSLQLFLQVFVGQELVAPFGQGLLDLALQDLPELHDNVKDPLLTFLHKGVIKGSVQMKMSQVYLN